MTIQNKSERIFSALPGTISMICETTGMGYPTVYRYVKIMHEMHSIHLSSWTYAANGGPAHPVYSSGRGIDVAAPIITKAGRAAKGVLSAPAITRDPLIAALFGTRGVR